MQGVQLRRFFLLSLCLLVATSWRDASLALGNPPSGTARHEPSTDENERSLEQLAGQLATNDPDLQRSLLEQVRRHPGWTAEATVLVRKWLADPRTARAREIELTGLIKFFAHRRVMEHQVAEILADAQTSQGTRLLLLRILARLGGGLPTSWEAAVGRFLEDPQLEIRHEALITVTACNLRGYDPRIQTISSQTDLPAGLRIAALWHLAPRTARLDPESFAFLTEQLCLKVDPMRRVDAARALSASQLDSEQLLNLCTVLGDVQATPGLLLLAAFAKSRDPNVGQALIDAFDQAPVATFLGVGDLDRILTSYPNEVRERAARLRERLMDRARDQTEKLAAVSSELLPGNPVKGQEVFLSGKAACSTCHRAADIGGGVGPNLSRIAFIRTRSELLESIIRPSAYVDPEFRSWIVVTESGRVFTGLLAQRTSDAIYLCTGPRTRSRVPIREIEEIQISRQSFMPEGVEQLISRQELSDLVEFLSRQY